MRIELEINGKAYPCYETMGAAREFKDLTGTDITKADMTEAATMCNYMYCCMKRASKREGLSFDIDIDDFADAIDEQTVRLWLTAVADARTQADNLDTKESKKKATADH